MNRIFDCFDYLATPCGLASLIVVLRMSFVGTSSLAIKIQSAPKLCVQENATCPCKSRWSTRVKINHVVPPKILLLRFLFATLSLQNWIISFELANVWWIVSEMAPPLKLCCQFNQQWQNSILRSSRNSVVGYNVKIHCSHCHRKYLW